jgi:hypothetical protein
MDLADLETAWAAQGSRLARRVTIDEARLRALLVREAQHALTPFVRRCAVELVLVLAALAATLPVLASHLTELRYLIAGGAVAAVSIGLLAHLALLLRRATRLDPALEVTVLQGALLRVRRLEYRALEWAILGGTLVWLPALLLLFEALSGVAALARVDGPWLLANLLFGIAVLALGKVLCQRRLARGTLGPKAQRFLDAISDRGVREASARLAELEGFVREGARVD